jgi:hypothetical protein
MASWTSALGSFLRAVFARESLPAAAEPPPPIPRRSAASVLFAPELLPEDPVEPRRAARDRGVLSLLFAPDPLPEDPPVPAPPRGRWLAWLFAPERLDD